MDGTPAFRYGRMKETGLFTIPPCVSDDHTTFNARLVRFILPRARGGMMLTGRAFLFPFKQFFNRDFQHLSDSL